MEIPVVNRISHFEVTALPIPSFPSQSTFSISGIEKVFSVWTWGALILAVIASFGTIITRVNFVIIRRLRHNTSEPISVLEEDDFSDIDDDDDDAYSVSTSSSVFDEEEEDDEDRRDEDFKVLGSGRNLRLRRGRSFAGLNLNRFSWSDFASGKSVVNLWDNLALGLDHDDDSDVDEYSGSGRVVSVYDMNKQKKINSFFAGSFQVPAAATSSRSTILTADTNASGRVALGVWDTRVGSRIPAMMAEWGPQIGRIVGVSSGGVDKVYVKDDVRGALMVGDVRKVGAPLRNVTDADVSDTWWDADAVMVSDECFDEVAAANGCDSAVTRCCSAVRSYLL
ncbi:PREDICTED: uncharacterized protein LOC101313412 [Fragaria vesca subsp. vesca]|uniref:uncharacterized protein LOC101313412 n=1 Tax=Fragaria vesca subsp. vesca TaxID=101020 RepID=UPI0002C2E2FF|nr:PREDICTED: uncharacterized protein LOC101313412 [Fragaria vesca subsp. vesca]